MVLGWFSDGSRTAQAYLRAAVPQLTPSIASAWVEKELIAYEAAIQRVTEESEPIVFGTASDGALGPRPAS